MKKFYIGFVVILFFVAINTSIAQEENKTQLWYCWEEVVHPEHVYEFFEANKEFAKICKEIDYASTYYAWTTGNFKYQFWHPINSLNDIEKIENDWKRVLEKYGKEKYAAYQKMIKSYHTRTATELAKLSLLPQNPRLPMDSINYMEFQEFYIVPGKEAEFARVMKKAVDYLKADGHNNPWRVARAELGYNGPMYIGWSVDKSKTDFMINDKKFGEKYGDYFKELNKEFLKTISSVKKGDSWFMRDISYISEN